ncbi:MAG: tetratricopeptide repeat protein [Promethearchaeota archaeon]|nr:MAG: tetratricopeptide repeat protein [Candidatus Lokiarchaeota archaeon]
MGIEIFISYAIKDSERLKIEKIAKKLEKKKGIDKVYYWEGWNGYPKGNIAVFIENGITNSEVFVAYCTKESNRSDACKKERDLAYNQHKHIISIFEDIKLVPKRFLPYKGIQIGQKNVSEIINEIHKMLVKKIIKFPTQFQTNTGEYHSKEVKIDEIKILKDIQKESNQIIKDFLVNEDNSVYFIDLSSKRIDRVPKSLYYLPQLKTVKFSEDSFINDSDVRNLVIEGFEVLIGQGEYEEGMIEFRNINKKSEIKHLKQITIDNIRILEKIIGNFKNLDTIIKDYEADLSDLIELGESSYNKGKIEDALNYFYPALKISNKNNDSKSTALILINIGKIYQLYGKNREAISVFQNIREMGRKLGDNEILIDTQNYLGLIYQIEGKNGIALNYHNYAANLCRDIDDKKRLCESLLYIEDVKRIWGFYGEANKLNNYIFELEKSIDDADIRALAYMKLGELQHIWANYIDALDSFNKALRLYEEKENKKGIGTALYKIGLIKYDRSEYEDCENYINDAIKIQENINDKLGLTKSYLRLGVLNRILSQIDNAEVYFEKALKLCSEIGYKKGKAEILLNIGMNLFYKFAAVKKVLYYYNQALQISEEIGDIRQVCWIKNAIGRYYSGFRLYDNAIKYYNEAMEIMTKIKDKRGLSIGLNSLGIAKISKELYKSALDLFEKSYKLRVEIGDKRGIGVALKNIGRVYSRLGDKEKTIDYFKKTLSIRKEIKDSGGICDILNFWGNFYFYNRDYGSALEKFRASLDKSTEIESNRDIARAYYNIAKTLFEVGNEEDSLKNYKKAVKYYEKIESWLDIGKTYKFLGNQYSARRKKREATKYYHKALDTYVDNKIWIEAAKSSFSLSSFYRKQDDLKNSVLYLKKSLEYHKKANDLIGMGQIYKNIGEYYINLKEYELAVENLSKSAEILNGKKQFEILEEVYLKLLYLNLKLNNFEDAIVFENKIKNCNEITNNWYKFAKATNMIATHQTKEEKYNDALDRFKLSLQIDQSIGNDSGVAYTYEKLGNFFLDQNKEEEAIENYQLAKKYFEKVANWSRVSYCLKSIGDIYLEQEKFEKFFDYYNESIKFIKRTRESNHLLTLLNTIDRYSQEIKNHEKLQRYYKSQADYYYRYRFYDQASKYFIKLGNFYFKQWGFIDNALENGKKYYHKAVESFVRINKWREVTELYFKLGDKYKEFYQYKEAIGAYKNAIEFAKEDKNEKNIARALTVIGNTYRSIKEYDKAIQFYNDALKYDIKLQNWQIAARGYMKIASVYKLMKKSKREDIINTYLKALEYENKYINSLKPEDRLNKKLYIFRIKNQLATLYQKERKWEEAYKYYKEILEEVDSLRFEDFQLYKIQSLRCLAKINENKGLTEDLINNYDEIGNCYVELNLRLHASFYFIIKMIFEADLLSEKGDHNESKEKLESIKDHISILLREEFQEFDENFVKLIKFRNKQVSMFIQREKAFISEEIGFKSEKKDKIKALLDALNHFKRCGNLAENLLEDKKSLDYQLYHGLSIYYIGHSNRIKSIIDKESKYLLLNETKSKFLEAKKIFTKLDQKLRVKNLEYEILLIEGKVFESKKEYDLAINKYMEAKNYLEKINPKKLPNILQYLKLVGPGLAGFPIHEFFLRKPSKGSSCLFIYDMRKKEDYINIILEKPISLEINKDGKLKVKVEIEENYYNFYTDESYILSFRQTSEQIPFLISDERKVEFTIPSNSKPGLKTYQIDLLDIQENTEICIFSKSFDIIYEDSSSKLPVKEKIDEKLVYYKDIYIKQLKSQISRRNFKELKIKLEELSEIPLEMGIGLLIKIFKDVVDGYIDLLKGNINETIKNYIDAIQTIGIINKTYQPENQKMFLEKIKRDYLARAIKVLKIMQKNQKKSPNSIESRIFEVKISEQKIKNDYYNKNLDEIAIKFINFCENLFGIIFSSKFNFNKNNFDWNNLSESLIDEYKSLLRDELMINNDKEIYLRKKLDFESLKCLLMVLDPSFKEFIIEYKSEFNAIRQARNDIVHGTGSLEFKIAKKIMIILDEIKKKYVDSYFKEDDIFSEQIKFFNDFIDFLTIKLRA